MTAETIQDWLIARVAQAARRDPDTIDIRDPFSSYGLNSIAAIGLTGELEKWLQLPLSPMVVWDHPTIESLVEHLRTELERRSESPAAGGERKDGG